MKCPCGECDLVFYHEGEYGYGIGYGCPGGKEKSAGMATEYRAWVCKKSMRAFREQQAQGKLPQVDKDKVRETRKIRNSMRPPWLGRRIR